MTELKCYSKQNCVFIVHKSEHAFEKEAIKYSHNRNAVAMIRTSSMLEPIAAPTTLDTVESAVSGTACIVGITPDCRTLWGK